MHRRLGFVLIWAVAMVPFQHVAAQGVAPALEEDGETRTSPEDAYGMRYARRKLVMPKGMMRGTFDLVIGRVSDEDTTTLNFGAAVSPAKYVEVGFSRYRMGSYPNPEVLRSLGGDGLIPIVAQGRDLIPAGSTNNRVCIPSAELGDKSAVS